MCGVHSSFPQLASELDNKTTITIVGTRYTVLVVIHEHIFHTPSNISQIPLFPEALYQCWRVCVSTASPRQQNQNGLPSRDRNKQDVNRRRDDLMEAETNSTRFTVFSPLDAHCPQSRLDGKTRVPHAAIIVAKRTRNGYIP